MILIALGANLPSSVGEPAETLRAALTSLERNGIVPVKVSPFYKSVAWPNANDPPFVNAVTNVRSELSPDALMRRLHEIERQFGRARGEKNAPRSLDLDLLDYNGRVQSGPPILPHPRMETRAFVLLPLSQVAPDWHHPVTGRSVPQLLAAIETEDLGTVLPLSEP